MDWEERRVTVWDCGALGTVVVGGKRKGGGEEGKQKGGGEGEKQKRGRKEGKGES